MKKLTLTDDYLVDIPESLIQMRSQIFMAFNDITLDASGPLTSARVTDICKLADAAAKLTLVTLAENRVKNKKLVHYIK